MHVTLNIYCVRNRISCHFCVQSTDLCLHLIIKHRIFCPFFFNTGSKECLVEAESLLELMQKMSKTDRKARHPREWLGREELPGIRRLVSNSSINRENKSKTRKNICLIFCQFGVNLLFSTLLAFLPVYSFLRITMQTSEGR